MTTVSVIMPVYNMKDYVRESVDSVLASTYKDLELILVDDGSTDGSSELCDEIAKDDMERIKIFHIDNHGVSYARNYGIERAKGQYILPVDSDDLIDKTYIEKAVKKIEENDNIGIVYCKAKKFGKLNQVWDLPEFSLQEILHGNIIFVTALFRKSDWGTVGGFSEELVYGIEDYDFWLSILELGRDVYQIPEILFYYRIRNNSRNTKFSQEEGELQLQTIKLIIQRHKKLYVDNIDILVDLYLTERNKVLIIKKKLGFLGEIGWKVYKKFLDR